MSHNAASFFCLEHEVLLRWDACLTHTARDGGVEGSRTPDLLIANETLYQLSYDPNSPTNEPAYFWHKSALRARRNKSGADRAEFK